MESRTIQLLVVGGTPAGLSVAIEAQESGLSDVVVLEPGASVVVPDLIGQHAIDIRYRERLQSLTTSDIGVEAITSAGRYHAQAVALAGHVIEVGSMPVQAGLADRVHQGTVPREPRDLDVLVVGSGELAVEWGMQLSRAGAGVVLAAGGLDLDRLSRVARTILLRLEAERRATILWHTVPDSIAELDGHPMAYFEERRTPDLQFDHVVFATAGRGEVEHLDFDVHVGHPDRIFAVRETATRDESDDNLRPVVAGDAWSAIRAVRFPDTSEPYRPPAQWRLGDRTTIEELRAKCYNATITSFERSHSDLWRIRVRPDHGDTSHLPGQYASLGLGYWEHRSDSASDRGLADRWGKLIRRSYSISSPIFDEVGYLYDAARSDELEFYIVLVPPSAHRIPALTTRLALKRPGDRIYLGPKVAGRYTLAPVNDPELTVVFLATGTGEAPNNAMTVELLRKGHQGPIVSVVSVRVLTDLGYRDEHARLERRFPNYHYLPIATREPGIPKRYVQDLIREDELTRFDVALDPALSHVYLCGNPAMIGLPEGDNGRFPEPVGAVELLVARGFALDQRGQRGTIHVEEYW